MELVSADQESTTVRFNRLEFAALLAIVHSAGLEYDALDSEIHNLSREQVEQIEDALFDLGGNAGAQRRDVK